MRLEIAAYLQEGDPGPTADRLIVADLGTLRLHPLETTLTLDDPASPLLVAAIDGIGKPGGVEASCKLAELLVEGLAGAAPGGSEEDWRRRITDALESANRRMLSFPRGLADPRAAVLTLAVIDRGVSVATVGDSASYVHRRGALAQFTCFDGGGEVMILEGTADAWVRRFMRRDCIGLFDGAPMEGDFQRFEPRRGDLLLLCTSGVLIGQQRTSAGELVSPPLGCPDDDPALVARTVVEQGSDPCGLRDASCLVVRFSGADLPDPDPDEPPIPWRWRSSGLPLFGGIRDDDG